MDRRPLQLLAALILLVSVLGLSTALVDEVREEMLAAQQASQDVTFTPPDQRSPGLPISEFTLLDPAPARLGDLDRAGNVLHLNEQALVTLQPGGRIQISPIELEGPSKVELPSGGTYQGNQLTCPDGCLIDTQQGRLTAPPNATLILPGATKLPIDRGEVGPRSAFDLPGGTRVVLSTITMSARTPLPLGPGTTIVLPNPPAGSNQDLSGTQYQLPAGTIVRGKLADDRAAQRLLDQSRQGPADPTRLPPPAAPQKPTIEVTEVPDAIRKGTVFTVAGHVLGPDGEPSVDHPVTIYANATKQAPGFEIQLGNIRTQDDGSFEAPARINQSRPTQPYHIVAKAEPRLDQDPPLLEAWSDPVVEVTGSPTIDLDLPATEGAQVPIPLRATLTDEFGAPVPGQRVVFRAEESSLPPLSAITDRTGEAVVILEAGFPFPGTWNVSATFEGTQHLDPASTWATIDIIDARIKTEPTVVIPRGETGTLNGEVRLEGEPGRHVQIVGTYADQRVNATTDQQGSFQLHLPVPPDLSVGNHTLELETQGVTASRTVVVTVTGQTRLTAQPPTVAPLGGTLPLRVTATDELGTPLTSLEVIARPPGGAEARALTDEQGRTIVPVSLASIGHWNLTLRSPGDRGHSDTRTQIPMHVGPLQIQGAPRLSPGQATNASLRLTVDDRPLASEPVVLQLAGTDTGGATDQQGRIDLPIALPADAQPGIREARLDLPRYGIGQTLPVKVLQAPQLELDVQRSGETGDPIVLEITALGPDGTLSGIPLTIRATGAVTATHQATTGPDGTTTVTIDRPRGADGLTVVSVQAEETDTTATAAKVASVQVTPAPLPWGWLAGIVAAGLAAFVVWRYRQDKGEAKEPAPVGPALNLSLGPQGDGFPPVWHPQEPTQLTVQLSTRAGHPIAGASVRIQGPHGSATVQLDEDGRATLPVPPTDGDLMSFHASFQGQDVHPPTETSLDVRLVDYREEIDREYRDLQEAAAHQGRCGTDATPWELARAYRQPEAARLVRIFERAGYSPAPVDRSDYEAFMKAKRALRGDGFDADS